MLVTDSDEGKNSFMFPWKNEGLERKLTSFLSETWTKLLFDNHNEFASITEKILVLQLSCGATHILHSVRPVDRF